MADAQYLKRLKDLEDPLPEDSPIFLPARPTNPESGPQYDKPADQFKFPPVPTAEERARKWSEYQEKIQLPATLTLASFPRYYVCLLEKKNLLRTS